MENSACSPDLEQSDFHPMPALKKILATTDLKTLARWNELQHNG
jgi:hypothetical protein